MSDKKIDYNKMFLQTRPAEWDNPASVKRSLGYETDEFGATIPHQIPVDVFERMKNRTRKIQRVKLKDKVKTVALYACGAAALVFTAYNMHEYNKSFDNCLRLLEQIEVNSAILDQEINTLSKSINGLVEVDYE